LYKVNLQKTLSPVRANTQDVSLGPQSPAMTKPNSIARWAKLKLFKTMATGEYSEDI
jgi:hypothetical protein